MFLVEQCFHGKELAERIDLIESWDSQIDLRTVAGRPLLAIVPERRRSVAVSLAWGGGIPATDAFWEGPLNESLRGRRCLIPMTAMHLRSGSEWKGVRSAQDRMFFSAGIIVQPRFSQVEYCLTLGGQIAESILSPLVPLAVSPALTGYWTHGIATEDLIKLLEGPPWSESLSIEREPEWATR